MGVATQSHNRELQLSAAIVAARIKSASSNSSEVHAAMADLSRILADASAAKFANAASEARLALGEIQMKSGERAAGRALLKSLEKDSSNAGFLVVAHKAAAALRVAPSQQ